MEVMQRPVTGEFQLARPGTLAEATALLSKEGDGAALLAGGTDLLVQLRSGKRTPRLVIDLKRVRELRSDIKDEGSALVIGCLTPLADIIADERIRRSFAVLAEASSTVGSVQIRNRATLAGNVCNASPAADTVPALLLHDAVVELVGRREKRSVQLREFFVGPGKTVRRGDEVVTAIRLPVSTEANGTAFDRLTRRRGVDLATINVACMVSESGRVRFAFGAVGPKPILVDDASGRLIDPAIDPKEREKLIEGLTGATSPISDVRASRDYRAAMLRVLSLRTLTTATERLKTGGG